MSSLWSRWRKSPANLTDLQRTYNLTNNYVTIVSATNAVGVSTNYPDERAAGNSLTFFYRVRHVP